MPVFAKTASPQRPNSLHSSYVRPLEKRLFHKL
jgi:hypothetical protein